MGSAKSFIRSVRFWGIFSILAPSILIVILNIIIHYHSFNNSMNKFEKDLIVEKKQIIKSRINHIIDFINYNRMSLQRRLVTKCREKAINAYNIIENLSKEVKNKSKLIKITKNILISYGETEGKYIIITLDGKNILNGQDRKLKEKILSDMMKDKRDDFIQIKEKSHRKRLIYVKLLPSLGWIIGYILNPEKEEQQLKANLLKALGKIRFNIPNSYIFVVSFNGTVLMHGAQPSLIGKNMWNATDIHGVKIIQEAKKVIETRGWGFIHYCWLNPDTGKVSPKITFVGEIKDWGWILCCGVYVDEIQKKINIVRNQFLSSLKSVTFYSIITTVALLILFFYAFRRVTRHFNKEIKKLLHLFHDTVIYNKPIEPSILRYTEFRDLAKNSNNILLQKIKAQKALEKKTRSLQRNEQRLRSLLYDVLDSSNVGVFILDSNFKIVWINKAIEEFFSLKRDEILWMDKRELIQEHIKYLFEHPEEFSEKVLSSYKNNTYIEQFECHVLGDNVRKERWLQHWSRPIYTGLYRGGRVEHYTDITFQKEIQDALLEREEYLRIMLRSIKEGVIATDMDGNITQMNSTAEELTGWDIKEAKGKKICQVLKVEEPEGKGPIMEEMVQKVLREGELRYISDYLILTSREGRYYYISCNGSLIKDEKGKLRGVVFVFRDETEKHRIEEEQLKMKKLESIGILAGGIAHDFNNILVGLFGNLELARLKISPRHRAYPHLKTAFFALEKAKNLANQLLTFARGGDPILDSVDIKDLIEDTVRFHLSGSSIKAHFHLSEDLWKIKGDKNQLSQVIANLVINAKEAMQVGGNLYIEAVNIEEEMEGGSGKPLVKISIRDEGCGIPEEYLDKIFDPYFSTKKMGSGLGLSIVYSIIKKHHGRIWVESEEGKGSTFYILLPADPRPSQGDTKRKDLQREKGETHDSCYVLLMDDEEMIREVASELLRELGCRVETARDGEEAIEKYMKEKQRGTPFDIVIMDLTIPGGMGGRQAGERLLQMDPTAKIIVTSGYSTDPVLAQFKRYGFKGRLVKPFRLEDLKEVLRAV